jgi:hypothetical protein
MKMFRHHYIPNHHELVSLPRLLEYFEKQPAPSRRAQQRPPMKTTAGNKMGKRPVVTVWTSA